jgi:hypothetical protein
VAKGGTGKCVAQCDCITESSDNLTFLKVCCGLDLFASYLLQDDEITVLLHIPDGPDLENFFRVCILIDVASGTFF